MHGRPHVPVQWGVARHLGGASGVAKKPGRARAPGLRGRLRPREFTRCSGRLCRSAGRPHRRVRGSRRASGTDAHAPASRAPSPNLPTGRAFRLFPDPAVGERRAASERAPGPHVRALLARRRPTCPFGRASARAPRSCSSCSSFSCASTSGRPPHSRWRSTVRAPPPRTNGRTPDSAPTPTCFSRMPCRGRTASRRPVQPRHGRDAWPRLG